MARERSRERSRDKEKHKSSRRRSRSRSRSKDRKSRKHSSRDRSRERDRSPGRRRDRKSSFSDAEQVQQAQMAIQQQQLQQQMLSQQLLLQQQAMMGGAASGKKQREVYVGNLTIGAVTDLMLRELFNGALAHLMPDPQLNPPVINVGMDPSGRFGFVEMRTEELASSAMALDKVELCGRNINVGRPKGYVEPPQGHAPPAQLASAQMFAARLGTGPTRVVLLKNMLKALQLLDETERSELMEDVREECGKYGTVEGIAVPRPPPTVGPAEPSRVYVKFGTPDESSRVKDAFNGRQFDGNSITAAFASEDDFNQAAAGKWTGAAPQAPGMGFMSSPIGGPAPLPAGISGIAALNPATGGMVNPNMAPVLDPATVPFQEGWIKLRGIPFAITKQDICAFFSTCGQMSEDKVKLVLGPDGRPTGEAYVEISGAGAKLRLALAKDRQIMPGSSRYIEIFTSTRDEVDRRTLTGVMLV